MISCRIFPHFIPCLLFSCKYTTSLDSSCFIIFFKIFPHIYSLFINFICVLRKIANLQTLLPFLLYFHYLLSTDITRWEINAMQSAIEVYTNTNYIGGGIEREREYA